MKNHQFGLWPKISLLIFLAAMIFNKFQIAGDDLKPDSRPGASLDELGAPASAINYDYLITGQFDEKVSPPDERIPVAYSQVATVDTVDVGDPDGSGGDNDSNGGLWAIIKQNWGLVVTALLGLLEVIVRLTPTEKDNSVFNFLKFLLDKIIPNRSQEGGAH